jgi:hypothetical protein
MRISIKSKATLACEKAYHDEQQARWDLVLISAGGVEEALRMFPDHPSLQASALSLRHSVRAMAQCLDRPFPIYWKQAIPLPPAEIRTQLDVLLCAAP